MTLRAAVAIDPDEYHLLFDASARAALARLVEPVVVDRVPDDVAASYDILVTSWSTHPFDPDVLEGGRLRLAVHAGGSVRAWYPLECLGGHFRLVQAGADAMAPAVAEFSLALSLAVLRNLHTHDRGMQQHDWASAGHGLLGDALEAQQIGIVGLSRTGRRYAQLVRALGATSVRAFDPYVDPGWAAENRIEPVDLDELLRSSSLVAVHAPATPETHHLIDRRRLALLADGAIIVNTARSWVIDQAALADEVTAGRLRAALDVFDEEPLPADSVLLGLPGVLVTPHVAGGTRQARAAQGWAVVESVRAHLAGAPLVSEVTASDYVHLA